MVGKTLNITSIHWILSAIFRALIIRIGIFSQDWGQERARFTRCRAAADSLHNSSITEIFSVLKVSWSPNRNPGSFPFGLSLLRNPLTAFAVGYLQRCYAARNHFTLIIFVISRWCLLNWKARLKDIKMSAMWTVAESASNPKTLTDVSWNCYLWPAVYD